MKSISRQIGLKSQDILILAKLILLAQAHWRFEDLSRETGVSVSECHSAIQRLLASKLVRKEQGVVKVNLLAAKEFLFYGMPYVFPAQFDRVTKGIPVAHSGPLLNKKFVYEPSDVYVWPDIDGHIKGECLIPLYKTVPLAAKKDAKFYELLSLIETLRVGRVREIKMAREYLEEKLKA